MVVGMCETQAPLLERVWSRSEPVHIQTCFGFGKYYNRD